MPESLEHLECENNEITQLNNLPSGLTHLECQYNQIKELKNLPSGINPDNILGIQTTEEE